MNPWVLVAMIGIQLALRLFQPAPKPLETIQISSSAEGEPIPFIKGTVRTAGLLAWASDVRGFIVKDKKGVKRWEYFQDVHYEFCGNEIRNVHRFWFDAEATYDARPGQPVSNKFPNMEITVIYGTEDQQPPATMEIAEGVGEVSAHRGVGGLFLKDLPLHEAGFRLPNVTAEVLSQESDSKDPVERYPFRMTNDNGFVNGTSYTGFAFTYDDQNNLLYAIHRNDADTAFVIGKYDTTNGDLLLETTLTGYASTITLSAYSTYSQYGAWARLLSLSGDRQVLWMINPLGTAGNQTYEMWVLDTATLTVQDKDAVTTSPTNMKWMDGHLLVNGDGTIAIKIGGKEGGGPTSGSGNTSLAHVFEWTAGGTPLTGNITDTVTNLATAKPNISLIIGGVIDANDDMHLLVRDHIVAFTTFSWMIRKYTIDGSNNLGVADEEVLNNINYNLPTGANSDTDTPLNLSGITEYNGQIAYDPIADQLVVLTFRMSDEYGDDPYYATTIKRFDTSLNEVSAIDVPFQWYNTLGYNGLMGSWLYSPYAVAPAAAGNIWVEGQDPASASSLYVLKMNLETGEYNYYDMPTLWGQDINVTFNSLTAAMYYNQAQNSFMTFQTADGTAAANLVILNLPGAVDLEQTCRDASLEVGMELTDFDYSAGRGIIVRGAICATRQSVRDWVSSLQPAFFFDIIESDWMLKLVMRANMTPVVTIPEDDVVMQGDSKPYFNFQDSDPLALPPWIDLKYIAFDRDYQPGSQPARLPQSSYLNVSSGNTGSVPVVMTDDEAATAAQRILDASWAEREPVDFQLSQKYLALEPSDLVYLERNGGLMECKIAGGDISPSFTMNMRVQSHDGEVYSLIKKASSKTWYIPQIPRIFSRPIFIPIDTALLTPKNDNAGMYCAVGSYSNAMPVAPCEITADSLDTGTVTGGFPTHGRYIEVDPPVTPVPYTSVDYVTVLHVAVKAGSFTSQPLYDVMADPSLNLVLWGEELIQYTTATQIQPGLWQLTGLLRGRMGTEWATETHVDYDQVVAIDEVSLSNIDYLLSDIGNTRDYAAHDPSHGLDSDDVSVTHVSNRLKPYAPFSTAVARDGSDNIDIDFQRRSRQPGMLFWPVPLFGGELQEFEVDVLDSPGGVVIRTITATASGNGSIVDNTNQTVYYDADDQVADGLTPGDPVSFVFYQLSNVVGRGHPGEELL